MLQWLERTETAAAETRNDTADALVGQLKALLLEAEGAEDVTWMAVKVQAVKAQFLCTCKKT